MNIDLNCDLGESMPGQSVNHDAEIMPYISSCNIACGFHSGSPRLMAQTIEAAIAQGVAIGAHPSYHDRENFGRVSLTVHREVLLAELLYQISALKGMVESQGQSLHHVKAHGALYHDMVADPGLARDFARLVRGIDPKLKIYALAGTQAIEVIRDESMVPVNEGFADRLYDRPDQLRSRKFEDAVLHDPAQVLRQVDGFLAGQVRVASGETCKLEVESICLHSDTPGAVQLGKMIHDHLIRNGIRISAIR